MEVCKLHGFPAECGLGTTKQQTWDYSRPIAFFTIPILTPYDGVRAGYQKSRDVHVHGWETRKHLPIHFMRLASASALKVEVRSGMVDWELRRAH